MIIKTGVSQWDSPTFVWLLLKEHCGMPSSFEQSGEMSVFARSEPTAMRAWRGNMWVLRMLISRFYSMLCLHWQRFSPSLSHIIFFFFWLFSPRKCCPTVGAPIRCTRGLSPSPALTPANNSACLSFSNCNEYSPKGRRA